MDAANALHVLEKVGIAGAIIFCIGFVIYKFIKLACE